MKVFTDTRIPIKMWSDKIESTMELNLKRITIGHYTSTGGSQIT